MNIIGLLIQQYSPSSGVVVLYLSIETGQMFTDEFGNWITI